MGLELVTWKSQVSSPPTLSNLLDYLWRIPTTPELSTHTLYLGADITYIYSLTSIFKYQNFYKIRSTKTKKKKNLLKQVQKYHTLYIFKSKINYIIEQASGFSSLNMVVYCSSKGVMESSTFLTKLAGAFLS